jgi:hypothetical protein
MNFWASYFFAGNFWLTNFWHGGGAAPPSPSMPVKFLSAAPRTFNITAEPR